jgi:hypothetical protein
VALTNKEIEAVKAMTKPERAAWLAKGRPGAKVRIDFEANVSYWAPMLRGGWLPGRFETFEDAYAAAAEFRRRCAAGEYPLPDEAQPAVAVEAS